MDFAKCDDGYEIGFDLIGDIGEPIIVVPGGPCRDPEYLIGLKDCFSNRTLVIMHHRGTSNTHVLSRGWWKDGADIMAVAKHLGLGTFDLVAHSAGTRAAIAAQTQFPHRIDSMLLITPPATWLTQTPHDGATIAARRNEPELLAALSSMEKPPTDENSFQQSLRDEAIAGYARWTKIEKQHSLSGEMSLEAALSWFKDIPDDAAEQILKTKMPPTLVIGGGEDILTGVEPVLEYASVLGAKAEIIEACGHYPWVEQPENFKRIIKDWYQK